MTVVVLLGDVVTEVETDAGVSVVIWSEHTLHFFSADLTHLRSQPFEQQNGSRKHTALEHNASSHDCPK